MFTNNAAGEYELSFRIDGKLVSGTFHVESGLVTATHNGESKTTQVDRSTPQAVARLLIREIVTHRTCEREGPEKTGPKWFEPGSKLNCFIGGPGVGMRMSGYERISC